MSIESEIEDIDRALLCHGSARPLANEMSLLGRRAALVRRFNAESEEEHRRFNDEVRRAHKQNEERWRLIRFRLNAWKKLTRRGGSR